MYACDEKGATALHRATARNYLETTRFLVTAGADVNARDTRHYATPADWAISHLRAVDGVLPVEIAWLFEAARTGNLPWATAMLTRLPFLARLPEAHGKPPLDHALDGGHRAMARLLEERGGNVR